MNSRHEEAVVSTDSAPVAAARQEEPATLIARRRWYRASGGLVTFGLVLSSLVILIALWQLVIVVFKVPDYLVPAPSAVFKTYFSGQIDWGAQTLVTLEEGVIGFVIGVAVGFAIAVILSTSPLVNRIVMPYVVAFHVLPKVAIAPVVFIMLGFTSVSKILIVVVLSFFPIVINVTTGLVDVDVNLVHLLRSLGVGPVTVFYKVRLPSSMPLFFDGLKIAVSGAMIGAIVAEFVSSNRGLGFVILNSQSTLDTSIAFAAIVILTVLGLLLYGAVILLGRLVMPWYRSN
jgi:NitT/TauT family transport system permease protein